MQLRSHRKAPTASQIRVYQLYTLGLASINSSKDVHDFKYMTNRRDIRETIDIVEVRGVAGNLPSLIDSLQAIIRRTTNISYLTVIFSIQPTLPVLPADLVFNNLTYLNVNVPHTTIMGFLLVHPHITSLVLGTCHASNNCPLIDCPLPSLRELTCPPGCVRAVTSAAPSLTRLVTVHNIDRDADASYRLLNYTIIPTSSTLTYLHIDFDSNMTLLLQRISAAAPALQVLRLTESRFSPVSGPLPWDNVHEWEGGLGLLTSLKELRLRSWRSLRETPGIEDIFIRTWLANSPPNLRNVKIWTKASTSGVGGRLTMWCPQGQGGWQKAVERQGKVDECDFL